MKEENTYNVKGIIGIVKKLYKNINNNCSQDCEQYTTFAKPILMITILFGKKYLQDLYEGKTRKYKDYKSNPTLVKQYVKTVNKLKAITYIEQLYQIKSLRYEKKEGNLKGKSAVWVNDQFRIIFQETSSKDNPEVIDILELEELSKHYQK